MRRWLGRAILAAAAAVAGYQVWILGHVLWYVDHNPATTAFIQERRQALAAHHREVAVRRQWVPYRRIAPALKRAVVAGEDASFVSNFGFDWDGIEDALLRDVNAGHIVAGGSTITQQLAKNLFLSPRRTLGRKAEEAVITVMLASAMSKRRILEIYLNVIEWGNGLYGAQAAARYYFHTRCGNLDAAQAALLAAMIPDPRYYQHHRSDPDLLRRARIIRDRMDK
ncbi:MAG TPA: monofunctional biosynthetic peptidoglycan transglycosylase, partial [Gammaproteobacteria bacterium]|nr:monofunctional biosynthetic peptidoglycan transglycosylase [Gammaproteobacteria bacterium]